MVFDELHFNCMLDGVYSIESTLITNYQIIMTGQKPKMVILGGKNYKLGYLESSLNQIGNQFRSCLVFNEIDFSWLEKSLKPILGPF